MNRGHVLAWTGLILCGCLALPRAAEGEGFLEFYKLGLAAIESEDWETASGMMHEAIDLQPEERVRVTKAFFFRHYLPHFYLGQARYGRNDCEGALAAWRESENQGVVTRLSEFEILAAGRSDCQRRLADLRFARTEAGRISENAAQAARSVRLGLAELSERGESVTVLSQQLAEAEARLARAQARLASSSHTLADVEGAAAGASEAAEQLASLLRAIERKLALLESQRRQIWADLQSAVGSGRRRLVETESLEPFPAEIGALRSEIEQLLERVDGLANESDIDELQQLRWRIEQATDRLDQAAIPPPPGLARAAAAFLAGDYQAVMGLLANESFSSPKATSQSHLLNAAALFALFRAGGAADPGLLARARQEVLACRRADSTQRPSSSVFSPRFVEFFEQSDPQSVQTDEGS